MPIPLQANSRFVVTQTRVFIEALWAFFILQAIERILQLNLVLLEMYQSEDPELELDAELSRSKSSFWSKGPFPAADKQFESASVCVEWLIMIVF